MNHTMDIKSIIQSGGVLLGVTAADLEHFADYLIERVQEKKVAEEQQMQKAEIEEKFLTTEEVKALFGVCDTTLWSWHKHGLLRHRKFGKKNMYAMSDINRFMSDHADNTTVSGFAKWHGKTTTEATG